VDLERTEAQAEALLATRRILARLKLELLETGEDLAARRFRHGPGGSATGDGERLRGGSARR